MQPRPIGTATLAALIPSKPNKLSMGGVTVDEVLSQHWTGSVLHSLAGVVAAVATVAAARTKRVVETAALANMTKDEIATDRTGSVWMGGR